MRQQKGLIYEIASGSFACLWVVADKGYVLQDAERGDPGPWLVPQGNEGHEYAPLSQTTSQALHRKFARLNSQESIIGFANQYGLLGEPRMLGPKSGGKVVWGETLVHWQEQSREMGTLLALWDLVESEDIERLEQIIKWQGKDYMGLELKPTYSVTQKRWQIQPFSLEEMIVATKVGADHEYPKEGSRSAILASPEVHPELLGNWKTGELIGPAKYYVCRELNEHLDGHVSPKILPFQEDSVYLFPDSLLSALWLMFLNEVTGKTKVQYCDHCGEPIEVTRKSGRYCGGSCRTMAWKKRKQKASSEDKSAY